MEDGVELSGDVENGSGKENLEDEKNPLKSGNFDNSDSLPNQENNKLDISSAKLNGDREDIVATDKNDFTVLNETLPNVDQEPKLVTTGYDESKISKEREEKEESKALDDEDKEGDSMYEPMTTRSKLAMLASLTSSSELTIQLVSKDTDKNNDAKNVKFDEMNTNEKVPKVEITLSKPKTRSQSVDSTTSVDKVKNLEVKSKSQKRKADTEDKSESNEKFPILYKGFKKKSVTELPDKQEKKVNLKWNPFNPAAACKRDPKVAKPRHICDEIDSSSLQSEYAQYLGLQPILKFKCSNCGMSSFQSMSALNSHQVDCKKQDKPVLGPQMPVQLNPINEPKSANIKLTRKVFLCSACGTYYEHWNLFLHMREVHRRYICLFCLGMFSVADKLAEHLTQKHNVSKQDFQSVDDFTKCYQTFFLLCLVCDKVFSETDTFSDHSCEPKKNIESLEGSSITAKQENSANQNQAKTSQDSHQPSMKSGGKRTRESAKKSFSQQKSLHSKKDINASNTLKAETTEACEMSSVSSLMPPEAQPKTENELNEKNEENMPPTAEQPNTKSAVSDVDMKNVNETKFDSNQTNQEVSETLNCHSVPVKSLKKVRKVKKVVKKLVRKKKLPITPPVVLPPVQEESPLLPSIISTTDSDPTAPMDQGEILEKECINNNEQVKVKDDVDDREKDYNKMEVDVPQPQPQNTPKSPKVNQEFEFTNKLTIPKSLFKLKLQSTLDSDNESDDSQKLSLVVDEHASSATNSDNENSKDDRIAQFKEKINENSSSQGSTSFDDDPAKVSQNVTENVNDIALAGEEVAVMALALDDKIDNISIQTVVKECVRTSCLTCNYCRHASKIAVNGKQLALHLLSEHRYMPTKNETTEDVINKLRQSLDKLSTMFFNSETYDSTDPSVYVPYDQELRFNCFQCNHDSPSHKDLYAHKKKYHSKSLLLCIMCKSTFVSYSELICHLCPGMYSAEILNIDMKFRCCLCPLDTIPSGFRLMVHLRKSHHMCDICLEICQDQQKLSTHMWKHKLNHLCYRCGIAYASKPDITKHLFWKHGTESVLCKKCLQKKWPHVYHFCIPPTSFICEECNTSFSKAVALKVHKRIHGNDIPYACSQCEKKFVSKKLLKRHEERHNKPVSKIDSKIESDMNEEDSKEEIINVTDLPNENQEPLNINKNNSADDDENKENKPADGTIRKEKKSNSELDIPPLNLSSDSDSDDDGDDDDDDNSPKPQSTENEKDKGEDNVMSNEKTPVSEELLDNTKVSSNPESEIKVQDNLPEVDSVMPELKGVLDLPQPTENSTSEGLIDPVVSNAIDQHEKLLDIANLPFVNNFGEQLLVDPAQLVDNSSHLLNTHDSTKVPDSQADEIWENFYKTNPQNSSLPYPLCAMKSEVAYGIIMGDHDYCQRSTKSEPLIKEELPSNLGPGLSDDKLEETTGIDSKQTNEIKDENPSLTDSPRKKPKSPKKRISKPSGDNSSSSSSDSSDTDSSTCSCGTNCSCSSSSSSGSSSSSSDSESSGPEDSSKAKEPRPKKRKERRSRTKTEIDPEGDKEPLSNTILPAAPEPETVTETQTIKSEEIKQEPQAEHKMKHDETEEPNILIDPEDPPIRESELETDETSSDEEFYDSQPQRRVSQLMAEKRNQLMQNTAAGVPSNNGNSSPTYMAEPLLNTTLPMTPYPLTPPTEIPVTQTPTSLTPKSRVRPKRNRKAVPKIKVPIEKPIQNSSPFPQQFMDIPKSFSPYHQPVTLPESKPLTPLQKPISSFMPSENTPGGSENDKSRSSKRRRIPNKFYGYSSGEEDEKPTFKWRKQDTPSHHKTTPPSQPILPPPPPPQPSTPTPRIQLTVPKHVIRKTPKAAKIKVQTSSNDSSDSGSEEVKRPQFMRSIPVPPPPMPAPQPSHGSQKPDKDVYCYCRCPYDEVSEMIACDDENCTIEWFHFECVGIMVPPRGEWFCPGCRKARGLPPA
ncbi:uncharacterized protein LOC106661401 [Cimex lectularius]|uniref:Chromatin modification-related protein YNG2 n=1 Tax=Cimex lectularius TaxID=79782 RepID=A0A8I6R721_CIMLE|nr:uncharacterized protein LOC106661401 [Cimex lectularius]